MKQIISALLCLLMCLSFSVISFAEGNNRTPEAGDTVVFGHYEQDNDLENGPEPIEWRVSEVKGNKMLLFSEYILDALPYNTELHDTSWETSYIRQWLNSDFKNEAFSVEEGNTICLTQVENNPEQFFGSYFGSYISEDYIFILSFDEIYTRDWEKVAAPATDFAKSKIELVNDAGGHVDVDFTSTKYTPYWTRSPSKSWHSVLSSRYDDSDPYLLKCVYDIQSSNGIRPAMWVDINKYLDLLPAPESEKPTEELKSITMSEDIAVNTVLGETTWKMWLPEDFVADELSEADVAEHYIGYYLRDDNIIAVQYSDISVSLIDWQKEIEERGFSIEGLYLINGSEAVLYRNEEADTMTASILDGKGKLLEVTFYPYSKMSDEADTVISSIQQEAAKRRLSGASGSSANTVSSEETEEQAYEAMVTAYKDKRYSDSYSYYEKAKGYKDADKYGNLLKVRLCFALNIKDSEIEALEKTIVNDIAFEDSADVLVCNSAIAHYYLLGYWRTSNGMHGYEMKANGGSTTTMPAVPKSGDYYAILNGIYWSYFDGKWEDRVAQYKFKPISKNQMEMYAYQTNQTFTFTKRN